MGRGAGSATSTRSSSSEVAVAAAVEVEEEVNDDIGEEDSLDFFSGEIQTQREPFFVKKMVSA